MRRKRYLVRIANSDSIPVSQYRNVREKLRSALEVWGCILNSSRISSVAIEADFFAPDDGASEKAVGLLSRIDRLLTVTVLSDEAEEHGNKEEVLERSRLLFNEERFWEVHETVEGIWRKAEGAEKTVQQGIILYAAAYVHHQKNEPETALAMLKRATDKMVWPGDSYHCFDLGLMKRKASGMIADGTVEVFRLP